MSVAYEVLQAPDADEMVQLLAKAFAHRDPPAVAVDLSVSEFEDFVRVLSPKAAKEGLTIVARDVSTGKLLGALLADDCASEMPTGLDQLSPKFDPIFDILDQLGSKYWSEHETRIGEAVHIFLLGVSDEAAGQGVATGLLQFCLSHATQNGYSKAVTEATNRVSQHIFRKLGFIEQGRGSYEAYRLNGQAIFSSIADEGGPMIMDYRLRDE